MNCRWPGHTDEPSWYRVLTLMLLVLCPVMWRLGRRVVPASAVPELPAAAANADPELPVAPRVDPAAYRESSQALPASLAAHLWFALAVVLAGLPALWVASAPGQLTGLLVSLALSLFLGVIWLAWLLLSAVGGPGLTWRFLLAPAVVVAMGVLVLSSVPLQARFALNRADLEAAVAALPAGEGDGGHVSAGSYTFYQWERFESGVLFEQDGFGFGPDGFAYLPDGVPDDPSLGALWGYQEFHFSHLDGPWYSWSAIW